MGNAGIKIEERAKSAQRVHCSPSMTLGVFAKLPFVSTANATGEMFHVLIQPSRL